MLVAAERAVLKAAMSYKKVAELIKATTKRVEWRTSYFNMKIKSDEDAFCQAHIAETNRHATVMNKLVRARKLALHQQEAARLKAQSQDGILQNVLVELMEELQLAVPLELPLEAST
jgi:tmRNA-binding protein